MKFFLDTADLAEIEEAASWGVLAGVTTNPTLYARIGGRLADFPDHIKRICELVDGPVSAESVAMTRDEIVRDGRELASHRPQRGGEDTHHGRRPRGHAHAGAGGHPGEHDAVLHGAQAIMAARAGARYISPFVGRFDDISEDGLFQLEQVCSAVGNYDFTASTANGEQVEIIAASVRSANHVTQAALMGADIATVPFAALKKCVQHPLTDRGLGRVP